MPRVFLIGLVVALAGCAADTSRSTPGGKASLARTGSFVDCQQLTAADRHWVNFSTGCKELPVPN